MNTLIKQYDNIISNDSCEYMIECFEKYKDLTYQGVTMKGVDLNFKRSQDLNILTLSSVIPEFEKGQKQTSGPVRKFDRKIDEVIIPEIYSGIKDCLIKYCKENPFIPIGHSGKLDDHTDKEIWEKIYSNLMEDRSSILLKSYNKNEGLFNWHIDTGMGDWKSYSRLLVTMFYLNDVEKGGETEFKHQGVSIKPKKGSVVIFPAGWTHMHRGKKPISSDKYIGNIWWGWKNPAYIDAMKDFPAHWWTYKNY